MSIRILLADDHVLVRQGLRRILETRPEFEVVAEASNGEEAIAFAQSAAPDVIVLDVTMRGLNGLDALVQIRKALPACKAIMLSMHADERYVVRALRDGARGYVLKDCVEEELVEALLAVHAGSDFLSASVRPFVERAIRPDATPADRHDLLTGRERHIYQLLAEGNSNKDVANLLDLSLHTVETHRSRIMEKLGVRSAAELVLSAVRRGIVS